MFKGYYKLMVALSKLRLTKLERSIYDMAVPLFGGRYNQPYCSVYRDGMVVIFKGKLNIKIDKGIMQVFGDSCGTEKTIKVSPYLHKALYYSKMIYDMERDAEREYELAIKDEIEESKRLDESVQNDILTTISNIQVMEAMEERVRPKADVVADAADEILNKIRAKRREVVYNANKPIKIGDISAKYR